MQQGILRRAGAAVAAAVGVSIGLIPLAAPAGAIEGFAFERLAGANRYETAAEIAAETFPTGAETVVLARDALNSPDADALSGNYVAGINNAPILITPTDSLHPATDAALEDLEAENVIIMGGTAAISAAVEDALETDGYTVTRVEGPNRYGTAADALTLGGPIGEIDGLRTAFLARSEPGINTSADALSVGPVSYGENIPVLLTTQSTTPAETLAALDNADIEQIYILGGTDAISQAQQDALDANYAISRVGGANRSETSILIAEDVAVGKFGWNLDHVNLARGDDSADALAGGPHGGEEESPLLITMGFCFIVEATEDFFTEHAGELVSGHIYGGTAAVCQEIEDTLEAAAQGEGQAFSVSPAGQQTLTEEDNTQEFTVTGVENPVTIALFPCESVNETGQFGDQDDDGEADGQGGSSGSEFGFGTIEITEVQGEDQAEGTTEVEDVTPVGGQVVFSVTGSEFDCAIAVIYEDTDGDGSLDLDDNDRPTEPFAIAGPITFTPDELATGECFEGFVLAEDEDANELTIATVDEETGEVTDTFTVTYGENDDFFYNGEEGRFALGDDEEFEEVVTQFDLIGTTEGQCYSQTGDNSFEVHDDTTDQVTGVNAVAGDFDGDNEDLDDDVRVSWNDATGGLVDSYTVYLVQLGETDAADDEEFESCDEVEAPALFGPDGTANRDTSGDRSATADEDENSVTFEDLEDGDYCAVVQARSETGSFSQPSEADEVTVNALPDDTTEPTIEDLRASEGGEDNELEAGDNVQFTFSESMDEDIETGTFRFTDEEGELFQVECVAVPSGDLGEATCTLGGVDDPETEDVDETNTVLVVELVDAPIRVGGEAGDGVADLPGTLTDVSAEFSDPAGNEVSLDPDDSDIEINQEVDPL